MGTLKTLLIFGLPVLLTTYFHFNDELKSNTVSWREIVENDKLVSVFENKRKSFILNNQEISISANSTLANEDLNILLTKWGVDPNGMNENNTTQKINLLLKISSPDFWSKNYAIHPKKARISNYLWVRSLHLNQLTALKELTNREQLRTMFVDFLKKLSEHAQYEDVALFKFLKENVDPDPYFDGLLDKLSKEHIFQLKNKATHILNQFDTRSSLNDLITEIADFEQHLIQHFTQEDQYVVPVMLNLENGLYRQYRSCPYLTWKYYFMY